MKGLVSFVETDKIKVGEYMGVRRREVNWGWHEAWMAHLIEQKIEAGLPRKQQAIEN